MEYKEDSYCYDCNSSWGIFIDSGQLAFSVVVRYYGKILDIIRKILGLVLCLLLTGCYYWKLEHGLGQHPDAQKGPQHQKIVVKNEVKE